jgi:hypothetical protein
MTQPIQPYGPAAADPVAAPATQPIQPYLSPEQQDEQNARALLMQQSGMQPYGPAQPAAAPAPQALAQPAPGTQPIAAAAMTAVPGQGGAAGGAPGGGAQLMPYGAVPGATTHPAGLSAADRGYLGATLEGDATEGDHVQASIDRNTALAQAAADQAKGYETDTDLAQKKFDQESEEAKKNQLEIGAAAKDRQGRIDTQLASLEAQGVDPNHYWNNMGTGSKVLAGIAVALGTFGSHPLGPHGSESTNTALGIINGAINNDLDAQRTNLTHQLNVAKMRGESARDQTEHEMAMAHAERDSIQTAYTVAMNTVAKKAAAAQGNTDVQAKLGGLNDALLNERDTHVERLNDKIYQINKNAERPVTVGGAGGKAEEWIRTRATKLADEFALDPASAQRRAAAEYFGKDVQPGAGAMGGLVKPPAAGKGGKPSPRITTRLADSDAAEAGLQNLDALLNKGTGFSKSDRAKVDQLVDELKKRGVDLPAGSLDFSTNTSARRAGIAQALIGVRNQRAALQARAAAGGADAESETAEDKPEKD